MARKKKLAIFRNNRNDGNTVDSKSKEMEQYRETLGDRTIPYTFFRNDKNLSNHQKDFLSDLTTTLAEFDVLGENQIPNLIRLSKLDEQICNLEQLFAVNVDEMIEVDYQYRQRYQFDFDTYRFTEKYRYYKRTLKLFEDLFYSTLCITWKDYQEFVDRPELEVQDTEEIIKLRQQENQLLKLIK